jgi:rhodanese-related sulfurtransferase
VEKIPEFALNHPFLCAALLAAVVFIIVMEVRRKLGPPMITGREAVGLINDQDALVLDVRDAADYKAGHILHAKHIPFSKLGEETGKLGADKARPIIVYCKSGTVSPLACARLKAGGHQSVYYLKNGLYGWLDENLPVEK